MDKRGLERRIAEQKVEVRVLEAWGALSDPELNPNFVRRANDMLAAAEVARRAQESAQPVQGA